MKSNAIFRIVLFSVAIVILLGILCVGIAAGLYMADFNFSEQGGTISSSGSVPANEIRNISIEWAAGSITFLRDDVDTITFSESSRSQDNEKMVWKQSGDELEIDFCETDHHFGLSFDGSKDLTVTVPRDWECGELELDVASASVEIEGMTIGSLNFDGASGICTLADCQISTLDMDIASGNVVFSGCLDQLDFDGASADLTLEVSNTPKHISMDTASGDLDLTLPETCGFTVKLNALSGRFTSDFSTTSVDGCHVYGDGSCSIDVSAMSGDVFIHKSTAAWNCDH